MRHKNSEAFRGLQAVIQESNTGFRGGPEKSQRYREITGTVRKGRSSPVHWKAHRKQRR